MIKSIFFRVVCPCNCDRFIRLNYTSANKDSEYNHFHEELSHRTIQELSNQATQKIWYHAIKKKGFEGAIQFFHRMAEVEGDN